MELHHDFTGVEVERVEKFDPSQKDLVVDVGDIESLNLFRQKVTARRREGKWLLLWDDGDICILFPGKSGLIRLTAVFSTEIDEILSYRWRNEEYIHGFGVSRNLAEGPDGVRSFKVRTWCDTVAHLGDTYLLEDVLCRMGGLYRTLPVRALDYEDGVEQVKEVLSRGWIWQEQGLSRLSATSYRFPWMSAIAWLYQQPSRSRAARSLPGVVLSASVHVIAVREHVEGMYAEQLFGTIGLKALWKFDRKYSLSAWIEYKPRNCYLDVSAMRPGALSNCYESTLKNPEDAPHAFMGVMLSAAGKSVDDLEHRAKLHSQMIRDVLDSGGDWHVQKYAFPGNCNGAMLQPKSGLSDIRPIPGFIPPFSMSSGLLMFIFSWCVSITIWFFLSVWLFHDLDMSSWDVRAMYTLNIYMWCWVGFLYGNEFIRRVIDFKTLPTSSLMFICAYWSVACVHGCLHCYAIMTNDRTLAYYTLVYIGIAGGSVFVIILNREAWAVGKFTPAWLSRCLGANQAHFKLLGEPFAGQWYEVRMATGAVVKLWSAAKLVPGADLRLLAVRSDGQLARLELSCGVVFVRVLEMVEAIDKTLDGELSLFAHSPEMTSKPNHLNPSWREYFIEFLARNYFRGDHISAKLFSTRQMPLVQSTQRLRLSVDKRSLLGILVADLSDGVVQDLSLTKAIKRAIDEGKSTKTIFGSNNVISISRLANLAYVSDHVRKCETLQGDFGVPGLCNVGLGELDSLILERYVCLIAGLGWLFYACSIGCPFYAFAVATGLWSLPHIVLAMGSYSDLCEIERIYRLVDNWLIGHAESEGIYFS